MSHYRLYPAYKDSGIEWIGEVPEHWEVKRMRHAAAFTNSNVDKKSYSGQDYITLCNYTDVYYNEFITSKIPFMPATASRDEITKFSLRKGDVLITKDSEAPDDIGIPSIVSEDVPGVICGYHLTLIRSSDLATARILHRVLQSHPTKAHFFVEAPGITRYGLSQDAIGDLRVCLPPPEERDAIADWIDRQTARIDALITKKTRFIELLKEKRQALITHAVTKGLNPNVKMKDSGIEWIGEVPENWSIVPLKIIAETVNGATPESKNTAYWDGDIAWYTPADIDNTVIKPLSIPQRQITEAGLASCSARLTPAGSIVISTRAPVGSIGITTTISTTNQGCRSITPAPSMPSILLASILAAARSELAQRSNGTTFQELSSESLRALRIPLPPIDERLSIASALDRQTARIDLIIEKTQRSIDLLRERRSALITAAVTGKIDLRGSL